MYVGLVILLIGGITAAFMAGLWGRGWIWAAIALLVALIAFMYARATRYYGEVRRAAGLGYYIPGKGGGGLLRRTPRSSRGCSARHARRSSARWALLDSLSSFGSW